MYVILIYESSLLTGEGALNIRLKSEYSSRVIAEKKYNDIDNSDSENILCLSSTLKPVIFYLDGKYIRCNNTKKYISTFSNNRLLCGGAPLFLCHDNALAVEFDDDNLNLNIENTNEKIIFGMKTVMFIHDPDILERGLLFVVVENRRNLFL